VTETGRSYRASINSAIRRTWGASLEDDIRRLAVELSIERDSRAVGMSFVEIGAIRHGRSSAH
jgi:hypothetical protein